jgi:hypothetical protein
MVSDTLGYMGKYLVGIILVFFLCSCKKCIECDCYKSGQFTPEEDCFITTDKSESARQFSNRLIREKDYDQCLCKY